MARIRTIKPEFWTSEQIVDCSPMARLLFIGMLNFADDNGVLKFSARTIKANVFPGDDDITSEIVLRLVGELVKFGLLGVYEAQGVDYLHILGFKKHQRVEKPNYKHPTPPKNPAAYKEWSPTDRQPNGDLFGDQSTPEGKGREGNVREAAPLPPAPVVEPSPAVAPAKPTRSAEAVTLGREVLGILNRDEGTVMHFGQVHAWLESGFKPEEIRAVAALAAPRIGADIRDPLKYLGRFMGEEVAKIRAAGGPAPAAGEGVVADRGRHEQWRARCKSFADKGMWLPGWGQKPGDDGCEAPAEVLAEFGFRIAHELQLRSA